MAALLGMALGGLAAYGAGQSRQKRAGQQKAADLMLQAGFQSGDPNAFDSPDIQSTIAKAYGSDFAKSLPHFAQSMNQPMPGMPAMPGMGGPQTAGTAPAGAAPAPGAPAPARGGPNLMLPKVAGNIPSQMPMTSVTGPSGAPVPGTTEGPAGRGGTLPAAAPPAAPAPAAATGPPPEHGDPNDPQTWLRYADSIQSIADQNPRNARLQEFAKSHIAEAKSRAEFLQKQQDLESGRADHKAEFQQTAADREQAHADMVAMRQQGLALQQQNEQANQQFKAITVQMQQSKNKDEQQQHFDSASRNLQTQLMNIQKLTTSATPASADQIKSQIDKWNAQARTLKTQADKAGLDYDESLFEPVTAKTIQNHPWLGGLSGTTTSIESGAAPPSATARPSGVGSDWTQTSVKGKPAWVSPDKTKAVFING